MIINSIKLKNLRSYEDETEFSFSPKENKNIVLHLYLRAHMRDLNNRYLKKKNKGYIGYRIIDKVRRIITKQIGMHYMTRELNMQFQRECMKNQEYYNLIKEKAEANYKRIKEKLQYD